MKRLPVDSDRNGSIDYYEADLTAATSCYSYGAVAKSLNGQRRSFKIGKAAPKKLTSFRPSMDWVR